MLYKKNIRIFPEINLELIWFIQSRNECLYRTQRYIQNNRKTYEKDLQIFVRAMCQRNTDCMIKRTKKYFLTFYTV